MQFYRAHSTLFLTAAAVIVVAVACFWLSKYVDRLDWLSDCLCGGTRRAGRRKIPSLVFSDGELLLSPRCTICILVVLPERLRYPGTLSMVLGGDISTTLILATITHYNLRESCIRLR